MAFQSISEAAAPAVKRAHSADALYHELMIRAHLNHAIKHAEEGRMVAGLSEALCAALETICAGVPDVPFPAAARSDAEFWADCATPVELECYLAAALRRIESTTFAPRARKRLFVALWDSMSEDDRRRFLSRVDPDGKFVRGAA